MFLMHITTHHAKCMLNYGYLTSARIMHTCIGKCDDVVKYSAPIFSSFLHCFFFIYAIIAIEHDFVIH